MFAGKYKKIQSMIYSPIPTSSAPMENNGREGNAGGFGEQWTKVSSTVKSGS